MSTLSPHSFHIPVMGISFTIDTPIKVAAYGITSAISIIEDNLVEVMRKYYYQQNNEHYEPIDTKQENYRIRRLTDYLNLVNRNVHSKFEQLKTSAFETGSEIVKYFEMLPENNVLKQHYNRFLQLPGNPFLIEDQAAVVIVPNQYFYLFHVCRSLRDKYDLPFYENGRRLIHRSYKK